MLKNKSLVAVTTGVIGLGFVLMTASSAAASSSASLDWNGYLRGHASYSSSTHQFSVTDDKSDCYGIEVEYSVDQAGIYTCYNHGGAGTTIHCTPKAGGHVEWEIWVMDNGAQVQGAATGFYSDVR